MQSSVWSSAHEPIFEAEFKSDFFGFASRCTRIKCNFESKSQIEYIHLKMFFAVNIIHIFDSDG